MIGKLAKTCSKNFWSLRECLTPRDVSHARDTGVLGAFSDDEIQCARKKYVRTREILIKYLVAFRWKHLL